MNFNTLLKYSSSNRLLENRGQYNIHHNCTSIISKIVKHQRRVIQISRKFINYWFLIRFLHKFFEIKRIQTIKDKFIILIKYILIIVMNEWTNIVWLFSKFHRECAIIFTLLNLICISIAIDISAKFFCFIRYFWNGREIQYVEIVMIKLTFLR